MEYLRGKKSIKEKKHFHLTMQGMGQKNIEIYVPEERLGSISLGLKNSFYIGWRFIAQIFI